MGQDESIRGYDRLARYYQAMEYLVFGGQLQKARIRLLDDLPPSQNVLVLGDGDGRFLSSLVSHHPRISALSVDQSEQMLALQRHRLSKVEHEGQIVFQADDVRRLILPQGHFCGIVCNFFLDCFTYEVLLEQLPLWLEWVKPNGFFHFVDFRLPDSGWQRLAGSMVLGGLHHFFRFQTGLSNRRLPEFEKLFSELRIKKELSVLSMGGLMTSELYRVR